MLIEVASDPRFNVVTLCDWHVPYEDKEKLGLGISFCGHIKPDVIIIHEAHDFYSLSKFNKDPLRLNNLQVEIDRVGGYFKQLRDACPKSRIILLDSNHMDRLRKYLWSQAPALAGLRGLKIENLLDLEKYNIEHKDFFSIRGVIFKHGKALRRYSAYTAKAEANEEGMSGVSGHSHRLGVYYDSRRGGDVSWVESGCLCKMNPEYVSGRPNWQSGFTLISFRGFTNTFDTNLIEIKNDAFMWGGKTFRAKTTEKK